MKNKIVLVTGGSRGLGQNMAVSLAGKGFDVVITYNSKRDEAEQVVQTIKQTGQKAAALQLDVSQSHSFAAFIVTLKQTLQQDFGTTHIDAVVNNAGAGTHAAYADTTEAQFDLMMNIHLKAPFFLTQQLLPMMNEGASIVNISSGLARFSYPGYDVYAIMKGAVETLTKYQAASLGSRKIRANTVAPGAIETDFGGGVVRDNADVNKHIASMTALGRVGVPDDIGNVVAFLCSNEARWVNGQRIEVSGGIHL
jgi:NAD(P)-dependent dehydrogenase (short-subunit alcohol dehydrogenase family)